MNPLDDIIIKGILRTDIDGKVQKEDDKIEYKEVFDSSTKEARGKYAKEMAALYNFQGGYLIFGVNDDLEVIGLQGFQEPDNADIANSVNTYFSPAIKFQTRKVEIDGKVVFVIYVEKRKDIPTVCIKSFPSVVQESTIYWRYSAQAAPISSGDLINLLNQLRGEETKELTDIARREYRAKFKPRLWINGGGGYGGDGSFKIPIDNKGQVGYLDDFEISNCNVEEQDIWFNRFGSSIPMENGRSVQLVGKSHKVHPQQLDFDMLLKYHDEEGFNYETKIEYRRGFARMKETIEL